MQVVPPTCVRKGPGTRGGSRSLQGESGVEGTEGSGNVFQLKDRTWRRGYCESCEDSDPPARAHDITLVFAYVVRLLVKPSESTSTTLGPSVKGPLLDLRVVVHKRLTHNINVLRYGSYKFYLIELDVLIDTCSYFGLRTTRFTRSTFSLLLYQGKCHSEFCYF